MTGDNSFISLAEDYQLIGGMIKEHEKRRSAIKAELIDKIGAHSSVLIDGEVFLTAKTVRKAARMQQAKACEYRDLRFKRSA
jgi:hypothetical protein